MNISIRLLSKLLHMLEYLRGRKTSTFNSSDFVEIVLELENRKIDINIDKK